MTTALLRPYRARVRTVGAFVLLACVLALAAAPSMEAQAQSTRGLARLVARFSDTTIVRGIATFDTLPTAAQTSALQQLGLAVQPMSRVPLAIVHGPVSAMRAAVKGGFARDVYPDEQIQLFDTASSDAMGTAALRASGLTGQGVTVAVVDSGCDASHPDLADHVVHNVKLYSAEYANIRPDGSNTIVVANETGPYQNTDIGGGHGTHVAGIIAADSTTVPGTRFGVAPDAELVCYSIGEVLFTTAVVSAYDHLLAQPDLWDVDVVNNSWGNSFRQFDPRDPVAVVTKAIADLGVVVVFAAGNSGHSDAEMSLNPFSQSPWVISVAAGSLDHRRADFSSNGLWFDNSRESEVGAGGHTLYSGDRIGLYHPDVTAPGASISSTCSTAGTAILACPPYTNAKASGTSMASPHVAGAAAVLLQANPKLKPHQVRAALQATATPVPTGNGTARPFWEVGYGYVDLEAAVNLVRSKSFGTKITQAQTVADQQVLAADGFAVQRSEFWTYDAPRVAVNGTDHRVFSTKVPATTTHLKVTLSHPSLAVLAENGMEYTVTVRDAAGQLLGTTTEAGVGAGTASVFFDLNTLDLTVIYGKFTFEVNGQLAVSDPDTIDSASLLGQMVTLQVAQLKAN